MKNNGIAIAVLVLGGLYLLHKSKAQAVNTTNSNQNKPNGTTLLPNNEPPINLVMIDGSHNFIDWYNGLNLNAMSNAFANYVRNIPVNQPLPLAQPGVINVNDY